MNIFKKAVAAAAFAAALTPAHAAVTNVLYGIKYDTTTCRFNIYMKVLNGSTTSPSEQAASTAQVSLVVAAGTAVGTTTFPLPNVNPTSIYANEPKVGLVTGGVLTRGTTPTGWVNSNVAEQRGALVNYDVYSFTPNVSNAYYPQLNTGDSIVLFSLNIATATCGANIRLWNNNIVQNGPSIPSGDPSSANFGGDDYNNGFGIGGPNDFYNSNIALIGPPKPKVTVNRSISNGNLYLSSTIAPGAVCAPITDFGWNGPGGFSSTNPNPVIPVTPVVFTGRYTLNVFDQLGCAASALTAAIPLPVTLTKFDASVTGCVTRLSWSTAVETAFDRFEVEYSPDAREFMNVGRVASKKQATGSAYDYSYTQAAGKGYYRLKMVDLNGTFKYSETVSAQTSCGVANGEITIAPNPTSGMVSIRGIVAGAEIRVMDMLGRVVANEVSTGAAISVNLGAYASGVYNVLVSQNGAWAKVGQIVRN